MGSYKMYTKLSKYLILEKQILGVFDDESEFEMALYNMEILLINIEKILIVYGVSLLFSNLKNTLIMHMSYLVLRKYAGGWHASKSYNCTIFSVITFVLIPWLIANLKFQLPVLFVVILTVFIVLTIWKYAPADTEKNPLISIKERKNMRYMSIFISVLLLLLILFVRNKTIEMNTLLGITLECCTIHPMFYKLTKRSYKNYENYEAIE